jgi:serine/threonine protein kinase
MANFGKWVCVRSLGEGGQAYTFVVHADHDPQKTEHVLKQLKNLNRRERFERELKACQALDHPNVLRVIDFDLAAAKPFLVTEYCRLGCLADVSWSSRSVLEVLDVFRQVCTGVAHAHHKLIVHRDIKPHNIYLRDERTPVVGDFGLCFIDEQGERLTATEEVAGSRFYTAPEMADGRATSVPFACDVYSLGKLLYWMLSGGRIFERERHREEGYVLRRDSVSPEYELVNQLLDRMIVEDPSGRYLTAESAVTAVDGLIDVIRARGHAIGLGIPQRCIFCAQGQYKIVANGIEAKDRARSDAHNSLGLASVGNPTWLIMICEACGNAQIFRPDLAPESVKRWQRKR